MFLCLRVRTFNKLSNQGFPVFNINAVFGFGAKKSAFYMEARQQRLSLLRLELIRWETDAYPGFHSAGPQGIIDPILDIEACDILLGIFWKRFGTPTADARSGTEHEIRKAIQSRHKSGRPQIMIYFKEAEFLPRSEAELEQYRLVLRFRDEFPKEGLYWTFKEVTDFERLTRNHLMNFIRSGVHYSAPEIQQAETREMKATLRDRAESLRIYRRMLVGTERYLPLRGVELAASDPSAGRKPMELARVYVDLDTRSQVPLEKGRQKKRKRSEMPFPPCPSWMCRFMIARSWGWICCSGWDGSFSPTAIRQRCCTRGKGNRSSRPKVGIRFVSPCLLSAVRTCS